MLLDDLDDELLGDLTNFNIVSWSRPSLINKWTEKVETLKILDLNSGQSAILKLQTYGAKPACVFALRILFEIFSGLGLPAHEWLCRCIDSGAVFEQVR